ncbi:MAG: hypothetical protein AAFO70_06815 [Pseudomonadota bacterium]
MVRALVILSCLIPAPAFAEALTFLAIASGPEGKQSQYEQFLKDVAPVWQRHGMSVVMRVTPLDPWPKRFDDIALLKVTSRDGFQAYLADPDYRAIADQRLKAVDRLVILEGPLGVLPASRPVGTQLSLVLQRDCRADVPAARVDLVGHVKGPRDQLFEEVGCIRFLTSDDAITGDVLDGFAVEVID